MTCNSIYCYLSSIVDIRAGTSTRPTRTRPDFTCIYKYMKIIITAIVSNVIICKNGGTLLGIAWLPNPHAFFDNVLMTVEFLWYCTCVKDRLGANNNFHHKWWIEYFNTTHIHSTWPGIGFLMKPEPSPKPPFSYSFQL